MDTPTKTAKPTRSPMTTDRENIVGVRLSAPEHERLTLAAAAIGLRISQYLRLAALEKASR